MSDTDDQAVERDDAGDEEIHAPADLVELHEILAFAEATEESS